MVRSASELISSWHYKRTPQGYIGPTYCQEKRGFSCVMQRQASSKVWGSETQYSYTLNPKPETLNPDPPQANELSPSGFVPRPGVEQDPANAPAES